ncbi:lysozyme-like protein 6 isoform X3 [Piliocolobus tephrosceles]|uniref:lysozyme-like protein 6 isoform X3 n=1 Tax=Piliocolobus tephrosceles TaxID=591936 RepID=UPI000C29D204|nr:lysozyme-like protein 6 isoform X3 [Piliocolobus tephrosceles]
MCNRTLATVCPTLAQHKYLIIVYLTDSLRHFLRKHPRTQLNFLFQELNRLNLESSNSKYSLNTDSPVSYIDSAVISPDTVPLGTGTSILSKQVQIKPKTGQSLLGGPAALSPLTPRPSNLSILLLYICLDDFLTPRFQPLLSFGILPLETPSPGDGSYLQNYTNTPSVIDVPSTGAPSKKSFCVLQSVARIGQTGTKSVFSQSGNHREVTPILAQTQSSGPQTSTTPQVLSPTIASPPKALPRRSSRLFTSDSSTTKIPQALREDQQKVCKTLRIVSPQLHLLPSKDDKDLLNPNLLAGIHCAKRIVSGARGMNNWVEWRLHCSGRPLSYWLTGCQLG